MVGAAVVSARRLQEKIFDVFGRSGVFGCFKPRWSKPRWARALIHLMTSQQCEDVSKTSDGGYRLKTLRNISNFAWISAKFYQNAFQKIPDVLLFDA